MNKEEKEEEKRKTNKFKIRNLHFLAPSETKFEHIEKKIIFYCAEKKTLLLYCCTFRIFTKSKIKKKIKISFFVAPPLVLIATRFGCIHHSKKKQEKKLTNFELDTTRIKKKIETWISQVKKKNLLFYILEQRSKSET